MAEDIHNLAKNLEKYEKKYLEGDSFFEEDKKDLENYPFIFQPTVNIPAY